MNPWCATWKRRRALFWPQEVELFRRYALPGKARILDAGCGTGEIASRLAELFPDASVLGVDVIDGHLEIARARFARFASRLSFERQRIFELKAAEKILDLAVCRHVLHSIPFAERVIAELARVTRRGGYLHFIPEDYGMLHFQRGTPDVRDFWYEAPATMGAATGTDLFVGRNADSILSRMGFDDIRVDYTIVDTVRVARETFAAIIEAWRDGYARPVSEVTAISYEKVLAYFNQMIANIRDPQGYAVWMVPVVAARVHT
jgi:ubiquinone/menaquinone biosynthesis C-methylase UbiE